MLPQLNSKKTLTMFVGTVVLVCVVIIGEQPSMAQDINKLLDFNSLGIYSELGSCLAKIHEDFAYCNTVAAEKGKKYLEGYDPNSEWVKRVKCCGLWRIRDCWHEPARKKCTKEQADHIFNLPYKLLPGIEDVCIDYLQDSENCKIPVWAIVTVVLVGLVLISAIIVTTVWCIRRRRARARRAAAAAINNDVEAEKEKFKPTSV